MLNRKTIAISAVVAAAVFFALQGGQYSTLDLFRQQSELGSLRQKIGSVKARNDSLAAYRKALASSPKLQERIARETWGMSRPGEIVYKFTDERGR